MNPANVEIATQTAGFMSSFTVGDILTISAQLIVVIIAFARVSMRLEQVCNTQQKFFTADGRPAFVYNDECGKKNTALEAMIKDQFRDLRTELKNDNEVAISARRAMFKRIEDQERRMILLEEKTKNV